MILFLIDGVELMPSEMELMVSLCCLTDFNSWVLRKQSGNYSAFVLNYHLHQSLIDKEEFALISISLNMFYQCFSTLIIRGFSI